MTGVIAAGTRARECRLLPLLSSQDFGSPDLRLLHELEETFQDSRKGSATNSTFGEAIDDHVASVEPDDRREHTIVQEFSQELHVTEQ